jgi:thaumarchaeosortase
MLLFYLLDAFFPYGQIGPLQFWANFIVAGVGLLSRLFGLPIYGFQNYLTIEGTKGFYRLAVYWPSVGVQSMIIYSLVMIVVAAKLQAPLVRKLVYMVVGVCGTIFLNVLRIFTIAYYGYAYATSGQQLDAFHNSIGEILFPIWIAIYLVIVLQLENMLIGREKPKKITAPDTTQAAKEEPQKRAESKTKIRPRRRIGKPSKSARRNARSTKKRGRSLKS